MGVLDPRMDDRPPTFYKGQWFGGVPHTRVVLVYPEATDVYEPLRGGIACATLLYTDDNPNNAYASWYQTYDFGFGDVVFRYSWEVTDIGGGECLMTALAEPPRGYDRHEGFLAQVSPDVSRPKILTGSAPVYDPRFGTRVEKWDVAEWSDVVSRWPNVLAGPWEG